MMNDLLVAIRDKIQRKKVVIAEIRKLRRSLLVEKQLLTHLVEARETIRLNAELVQQTNVTQLEDLASLGVQAVFKRPFKLHLIAKKRSGKPVYELIASEGKRNYKDPKGDLGHSFLDVAGLSFRIGIFTLQKPTPRPFLYLDEPFRNIGNGELAERAGLLLHKLSHDLHIQILLNTHTRELYDIGDRVWEFSLEDEITNVELVVDKWNKQ